MQTINDDIFDKADHYNDIPSSRACCLTDSSCYISTETYNSLIAVAHVSVQLAEHIFWTIGDPGERFGELPPIRGMNLRGNISDVKTTSYR